MGIVIQEITFDGRAPSLAQIAEKITALCGLPVMVTESNAEIKGDLYDLHGQIAFTGVPEEQINLWTYRPGTVRQFFQDAVGEVELPSAQNVTSLTEAEGTQAVHLESFVGKEPTLFNTTVWALEALGGRSRQPVSNEVQAYRQPLTADELHERQRLVHKQVRNAMLVGCLLLPCLIPFWLLSFLWMWMTVQSRMAKVMKQHRELDPRMRDDGL
jgi:hypothetical protein